MKTTLRVLACSLACSAACAAAEPVPPGAPARADVCSARFSAALPLRQQIEAMQGPIDAAIRTLDNAQIVLPSPTLASGNVTYLNITPNFAVRLDQVCVLGYFELLRDGQRRAVPLLVDHLEVVRSAHPSADGRTVESTRIFFRTPAIEEFIDASAAPVAWKFWARHQSLHLKIAAFAYVDGVRGTPYFGRDERIAISGKAPSVSAALLFALAFYVLAAAAMPAGAALKGSNRWRATMARLLPWNVTGCNGQTSLSQLQMLVFTLIVATLLFYQWLRTGLLQELSTDLLYLIGISTAGAAGSQLAGSVKKELDPAMYRYAQELGWFTAPPTPVITGAKASALLLTHERFDIYKFQMLVFSFVIAAYVIATGANELGNVQISATLLTLMGMSQGAYIAGRAATGLGALEDQLRGMQALQERHHASADPLLRAQSRERFALAAAQAAPLFADAFARVPRPFMLELPAQDASAALSPAAT